MSGGVYSEFVELRKLALKMAIDSVDEFGGEGIVQRAELYYQFLMKDH